MEDIKLIVAGDVRGNFKKFFERIEKTNKKAGPFEAVFCVGDFFGTEQQNDELIAYKNGCKHISAPTYILGPSTEEKSKFYEDLKDGEIFENLTYLGKRGLFTLSGGMKVAYLSGSEVPNDRKEANPVPSEFTLDDVVAVKHSCIVTKDYSSDYRGVDLLLTTQWPLGTNGPNKNTSKLVSFLCKEIKPRYHFCGLTTKYFEPPPYRWDKDGSTELSLCTRFIALADVLNTAKEKYLFALVMKPVSRMRMIDLIETTTDDVKSPLQALDYSGLVPKTENSKQQQFFYDMEAPGRQQRKRFNKEEENRNKRPRFTQIEQEKCWFCLSSPDVEKHLVISIGNSFYLALAKGPINEFHVLILSIGHIQSAALLNEDDWQELKRFKTALEKFFESQSYVVCFTERNYKASHLQIDALGINSGYAWKIAHAFEDKAEEHGLEFETLPELESANMLPQGPYFVAELPNGKAMLTRQMKRFPLHFARDVFCSENLLNCEEKVNWRDCTLSKEQEIEMVTNFREEFAKYDFTNE